MHRSLVLVTGGNGFIARHCILALLSGGYDVRATLRHAGAGGEIREALRAGGVDQTTLERLSFVSADLNRDAGWMEAVSGCAYVMHVASPLPDRLPRHESELIEPARDGTLRVLKAAAAAGVRRVVLTSSFAAVGFGHHEDRRPYTEHDWTP